MAQDLIIRYDDAFLADFAQLKCLLEAGDRPALQRFLLDRFSFVFRAFQRCAAAAAEGGMQAYAQADEETKRELMRPLSLRQYRMVERAFSPWKEEEGLVLWSLWDFLHDNGRIGEKKVMSSAEIGACSLILEQVHRCLVR